LWKRSFHDFDVFRGDYSFANSVITRLAYFAGRSNLRKKRLLRFARGEICFWGYGGFPDRTDYLQDTELVKKLQ
jgi:hypothetical protein